MMIPFLKLYIRIKWPTFWRHNRLFDVIRKWLLSLGLVVSILDQSLTFKHQLFILALSFRLPSPFFQPSQVSPYLPSIPPPSTNRLYRTLKFCVGKIKLWMTSNKLQLKDEKSECLLIYTDTISKCIWFFYYKQGQQDGRETLLAAQTSEISKNMSSKKK